MRTPDKLEFGLLPERRMDWRTLATSYGAEVVLILLLIGAGFIFPDTLRLRQSYTVTELIPRPDLKPEPVQPKPKAHRQPVVAKVPPPAAFPTAKLFVPKDMPKPKKKEEEEKAPQFEAKFKAPELVSVSALPERIIHTGAFGSSAAPTVSAPIQKVQTGGFGDPNGLPGQGKEGAHLTATKLGSFDLPEGAGNGNGAGGAKGIKGTIASAGFGNGIALGDNRGSRGTAVQTSGFGTQEVSHNAVKAVQADSGPATTSVEIISKPTPVYTKEARQLKLEGEVLLEVMFGANGQLHVNRVVQGLGHGLDEAAITAANQMRFKPALRNGSPVDSTAIVHVVFQMAY